MKKIIFFLFLTVQLSAQEMTLKKGIVVDSLKVSDTLDETYSLYLPTAFRGEKPWPVLFVFDGKGRGKSSAQFLQGIAEKQGYILVASNDINPNNGMLKNAEIASRLLTHAITLYPVDFAQIATVGSMEGAKVATAIPVIYDNILGVVAVGRQWINFEILDRKKSFSFIGVVGDEQFTFNGMQITANALSQMNFSGEIYIFEGDEEWPKPVIMSSAIGSLTLDAMKKRVRPMNSQLVEELFQQDLKRVNELMSRGEWLHAESLLQTMESKYEGLRQLSEVRTRQNQLSRSGSLAQQKREQERVREKESRLVDDFIYYLEEDIRTANFENLGWWNYQKNQFDSLTQRGGLEGKMANRLKDLISEMVMLNRQELKEARDASLVQKLLANMLQTIFDPTNFAAYKNIISLSAQDNDFGTALFYLEEMLKHGYEDKDALYNIEGTLGLKLTSEYNWLIEKYLGSSRYYDQQN